MGIRKHFEKKPDELKLQDLSLEHVSDKKPEFGVEEITEQSWDIIRQELTKENVKRYLENYEQMVAAADHMDYEAPSEEYVAQEYLSLLSLLRIASVDRFEDFELSDEENRRINDPDLILKAHRIEQMRSMSPQERGELRDKTIKMFQANPKMYILKDLYYLKIVDSNLFKDQEMPDSIKQFITEEIKTILERMRQPEWSHISNIDDLFKAILTLKILTADEVKVTNQGLKITMKKEDFKQTKKPRPERKNF